MKQVDPLALLVHKIAPQQFDIAQGFTYISIRDQMNRAAMVVDALVDSGHLDEGDAVPASTIFDPNSKTALSVQLVIFGAGAAGLAAAMAAKKRNLSFVLVERGSSIPGGVMASKAQRYVSVSMYEWPNVSSTQHGYPVAYPKVITDNKGVFALKLAEPMLIGDFAAAVKVVAGPDLAVWTSRGLGVVAATKSTSVVPQLAFTNATATPKTKNRLAAMLHRAVHIRPRHYRTPILIELDVGSGRLVGISANAVLYATGFEPESRYMDRDLTMFHEDNQPFWEYDTFDEHQAGLQESTLPTVLIQGSGDGALQDLFRMCVKRDPARNDPLRAWSELEERAKGMAVAAAVKAGGKSCADEASSRFDHALLAAKTAFADRDGYTTGHLTWRRSIEAYRHLDTEVWGLIRAWRGCSSLKHMFAAFEQMQRKDVDQVTLVRLPQASPNGADWSCFEKCYLLNRVWAWFLFEAGAFDLLNGVAEAFSRDNALPSQCRYQYSAKQVIRLQPDSALANLGSYTQTFDIVILRIGTQRAAEKGQHLGLLPRQITRLDLTRIAPPIRI